MYLYKKHSDEGREEVVEILWKMVGGLVIFSMLNFYLFLKLINKKYLNTFYPLITGKNYAVLTYHEAESDGSKFEIFGHHPSYYSSINEELMKWLNENWSKWVETRPDWFTADAIASVPADMLPVSVLQEMGGVKGRRESIEKMKKEKAEKLKDGSKRKQSVRGADLKLIQEVVGEEGGGCEGF